MYGLTGWSQLSPCLLIFYRIWSHTQHCPHQALDGKLWTWGGASADHYTKQSSRLFPEKRTMLTNNLSVIWRMNGHSQLWGDAQFSHLSANCQRWPRSTAIVTAAADLVRRWRAHPASADSCRGPTIPKHPQTNGIAHPKLQTNTTQQSQRPHQQPSQNTPDYDDQWHCLSQHHNSTTQHNHNHSGPTNN